MPEGCVSIIMDPMTCSLSNLLETIGTLSEKCIQELAFGVINALKQIHSKGQTYNGLTGTQVLFDIKGNVKISLGLKERITKDIEEQSALYQSKDSQILFNGYQSQTLNTNKEGDIYDLGQLLLLAALGSIEVERNDFNQTESCCLFHKLEKSSKYIQCFTIRFSKFFRDLLHRCLQFDKNKRPTIESIFLHPFFKSNTQIGPNVKLQEILQIRHELCKKTPSQFQCASEKTLDTVIDKIQLILPECKIQQYQENRIEDLALELGVDKRRIIDRIVPIMRYTKTELLQFVLQNHQVSLSSLLKQISLAHSLLQAMHEVMRFFFLYI